jgi:Tfp pilus assembly protein PilN
MPATLNFARRPFRDERPVFAVVGIALVAAATLAVANVRLYSSFHRSMSGTSRQIEDLTARRAAASKSAEQAKAALNNYRVSSLAQQSRGLIEIVAAHRFSWTGLLARLENVLPAEVRVTRLTPRFTDSGDVSLALMMIGRGEDSVVHTIAALSRDPAFTNIELHAESSPERGAPEGHTFELVVRYTPETASEEPAPTPQPKKRRGEARR